MKKAIIIVLALLCAVTEGVCSTVDVSSESALTTAISGGNDARLTDDLNLSTTLVIGSGASATIDLNGHTLSRNLTSSSDTISDNEVPDGGGIYNEIDASQGFTGTLDISSVSISGNKSTAHGGGITNKGTLTISGETISGNQCATNGGGIWTGTANGTLNMEGNPVVKDAASAASPPKPAYI